MPLEEHIDENMQDGAAYVDTRIQDSITLSPLCRFWKLVMAKNVPAHQAEPWAVTHVLDDAQRSAVQHLLAKHYNARLQGGKLSDYDLRVDLLDSTAGLPLWDFTLVPAGKISENTRIMVELETLDQVWCRPDASLACKALGQFTKKPGISKTQLHAEVETFQVNRKQALADGFPPDSLADGLQTVCATPGDDELNGWISVPLSEMVQGAYSQQLQRHNDKPLYRNTDANKTAEWLLCTKKGSWAFCDSESKETNTDGEVWGESVEVGEVSPISCLRWRISQNWLTTKGMPSKQTVEIHQGFLINVQVLFDEPRNSFDDGALVRAEAHISAGLPKRRHKGETAAQRADLKQKKAKEKKSTAAFLKEWKLTLEDVHPNGDCQFLSVAQQLASLQRIRDGACTLISHTERDNLAMHLRADAVRCMTNPPHHDRFAPFLGTDAGQGNALDGEGDEDFPGYCSRMSKPGQYGDEFTVKALALELKCTLQVFAWNATRDKIRITRHSSNPDLDANDQEPDADTVCATQGTVSIFQHVYQHSGAAHYNSIMQTEVKRSMHA